MNVIDTSALVELLLDTDLGRSVHDRVWSSSARWPIAPHLIDVEVSQVIRRLVRSNKLSPEHARATVEDLVAVKIVRYPHTELLERAFELRDNVTAYDAVFLALAEVQGATLITCDVKMSKVPGSRARVEVVR